MENIKCVVFDFDDTIVLSEQMKQYEFFEISKQYNEIGINYYNNNISKRPSRETFFKGLSTEIIKNTLIDEDVGKYLYINLLDRFSKSVLNNLCNGEELPNVSNFINYLYDKNYILYISSNSNEKDIIETLKHKNLFKYFKGIFGNSDIKQKHFKYIKDLENLNGNEICFIGDSESDYAVAYDSNIEFIGIVTERDDLKNVQCLKTNDYNRIMHYFE
tara:strand:+ start:283 stop:933 length:651 start_codon:yes stop_codon:yes gene_type:complete